MPSVGPYWSARAEASAATRAISAATSSDGKHGRVGQPAGERDDLGPRGDRHQVAHRGGLHPLRAAREQPGVPLEVARGRPGRAHGTGFAAGARAPWRLVYRHAARGTLAHHGLPPRPPPGRRAGGRDRHPARSCRCSWPARSPPRTSASTSTARTSRSSRSGRSCSACSSWSWRSTSSRRRAGRDAADRPPLLYMLLGARARARRAARGGVGRRPLERLVGRRDRRRRGCGARLPGRAAAVRPRPAAPRRCRRPRRCPSTRKASALGAAGLSILFPPLALFVIGALVWLLAGGRRREGEKYAGLRILR